jgi:hypothetical protein
VAGGRYLEAVQLLSRTADESAGPAGDRGLAGEPGPGTGPVPADSHLLGVRAPRHQPVWRPARRDHDRRADFPVQWLSGPGCGHSSPETNGRLTTALVVSQPKWRWSIEGQCSCADRAGADRAGAGGPLSAHPAKLVTRANRAKWSSGSLILLADTCSTRPSCASYFVVQSKRAQSARSRRSAVRGK